MMRAKDDYGDGGWVHQHGKEACEDGRVNGRCLRWDERKEGENEKTRK